MSVARYAIGIDLGTTHCALSYIDLTASDGDVSDRAENVEQHMLKIPQLTAAGMVESHLLLPSFYYLPHSQEFSPNDLRLPWRQHSTFIIGKLARERGAATPLRVVSSAKSWLCHSEVDRREAILPADAPLEVGKISPLEVSIRYLTHLRHAWNHYFPEAPFEEQDITVTIPASFDPAARDLTAEAAQAAQCQQLTLLEEPQAALYSWIQGTHGGWHDQVRVGDLIVVIDIGGGTTDFSLIAVIEREGTLELNRIAVGDHILLGGDNMDLALAHAVAGKLAQQNITLDPWQLRALTHGCCAAKEQLLSDESPHGGVDRVPIVVPSRGSRLVGGSIRTELTREEVVATLLEGFFPVVANDAKPDIAVRTGLTQLGLPYTHDAGITRHLAAFLIRQTDATVAFKDSEVSDSDNVNNHTGHFLHPTALLLNGGVFNSPILRRRMVDIINRWLSADNAPAARLLTGADLDLAVARGAAYYGYVRRSGGVKIQGGTAQAYYVGVESSAPAVPGVAPVVQALCIAPFGLEQGIETELPTQAFGLVVGEPVRFRFFGSSVRRQDRLGTLHEHWDSEEILDLGEIEITLPSENWPVGEVVPVYLRASVTKTGTLALEALPKDRSACWKIEFDVSKG